MQLQRSNRRPGTQVQHPVVEARGSTAFKGQLHFMNGVELQASQGLQGTSPFDQVNVRINGHPGELAHLCKAGTPGSPGEQRTHL